MVQLHHGPAAVRGDEGAGIHWGKPREGAHPRMNPESENLPDSLRNDRLPEVGSEKLKD
jgi:hypothetical protein